MKQGQGSFEFLVLIAVAFLILSIYFQFVSERTLIKKEEKQYFQLYDKISSIRTEFLMASGFKDGYHRTFHVPSTIGDREYTLGISNKTIYANTSKHDVSFLIPEVIGSIQKGDNTLRKTGGVLYLN